MDFVDELRGRFIKREALKLTPVESDILCDIEAMFIGHRLLYMPLNRGLSGAKKIIIKPVSLFPWLVKITSSSEAQAEKRGHDLFKLRVPPTNLPPLERVLERDGCAALLYRYVTGGLVSSPVGRLDVLLGNDSSRYIPLVFIDLFDVVLKKCHWADGHVEIKPLELPPLPDPEDGISSSDWNEIKERYNSFSIKVRGCRAPYGLVHGDLHPKNVLLTKNLDPLLIDLAIVTDRDCIYRDYAKMDSHLQFQVKAEVSAPFWKISERMFTVGELILPRSNRELASCMMAVRSTLWRTCLSRTVALLPEEVDLGYAGYLLYFLCRVSSKAGVSIDTKRRALVEIRALTGK